MVLTRRQKVETIVGTLFFLLFAGYFRYIFIDHYAYYGKDIVITALLFFVWFGMSKILTNYLSMTLSDYKPELPEVPALPEIDWSDSICP